MEDSKKLCCLIAIFLQIYTVKCVTENLGSLKIMDAMTQPRVKATKFASWVDQAGATALYRGDEKLTVFVFNDTSFNTIPSEDRATLNMMSSQWQYRDYVDTFTIQSEKNVDSWSDGAIEKPLNGRSLFIDKKRRTFTDLGGTSGTMGTYVNGAMIDTSYVTANGIIHRLVRPLLPVSGKNIYEWIHNPDFNIQTTQFKELMDRLRQNYLDALDPLTGQKVTLFLPSQQAFQTIPQSKFQGLSGQQLHDYFKMHFIPNDVVFTSYLEHQNSFATYQGSTRAIFMIQDDKVLVRVGGVTAQIIRGNITVENGVIHIIDRMLGYVYFTAREQINADCQEGLTCKFKSLIDRASPDVSAYISHSGANIFVPTDEAFRRVEQYRGLDFLTNITLTDFVVRLCILRDSDIEVARINGNYDIRKRRQTQYNDWKLVVYNDRNDTWVNGGHVRARIIRPDIDTTNNGRLQYIDAVPGVPWMDIPTLIEFDEYLLYTWNDIKMVGLDNYLKDPTFNMAQNPLPNKNFFDASYGQNTFTTTQNPYGNNNNNNNNNNYGNNNNQYGNNNNQYGNNYNDYGNNQYGNNQYGGQQTSSYHQCGSRYNVCRMTFFVPNGTATYNYALTGFGRTIRQDAPRYRFILRRLIVHGEIYLERLMASGISHRYRTDSGDEIIVKKETENLARIYWSGMSARVIMWDLGASNGVVHIIDNILSEYSDLTTDISGCSYVTGSLTLVGLLSSLLVTMFSFV